MSEEIRLAMSAMEVLGVVEGREGEGEAGGVGGREVGLWEDGGMGGVWGEGSTSMGQGGLRVGKVKEQGRGVGWGLRGVGWR